MKKRFFLFSKKSEIILYGAASIGHIMFQKLTDAGYKIVGFVDKRAEEIKEYLGKPVWLMESVPEKIKKSDDMIVLMAVKNVFEHQTVAAKLVERGFCNIIYKPYGILINNPSESDLKMDVVYEKIVNGVLEENLTVESTAKISGLYDKDYGICQQEDNYVTALIPVDFIFTNDYQNTAMEKWGNINILAFFTHLQFFAFLQGEGAASYLDYLNEYCVFTATLDGKIKITQEWKQNVLHNRAQIYEEMSKSLLLDKDFFFRSPPQGVWNEKGYFNLVSGKHRATFLASKGHYMIPLKVTNEDYSTFLNKEHLEEIKNYLVKGLMRKGFVPHPYCYRIPGISYAYYGIISAIVKNLSKRIYEKYGSVRFDKLTIVDETCDNGVLGAYFARMGSKVIRKSDFEEKSILEAIWRLGHVYGKIKEVNDLSQVREADILVTDLTLKDEAVPEISSIKFHECFAICQEDEYPFQLIKKHSFSRVLKIYNTFLEGGSIQLFWLY